MADIAEKLGVGLVLGVLVQGVFARELSFATSVAALIMAASALISLCISVYFSQED